VRLIPEIIESVFRIAVDPIFPPPLPYPRTKKFHYYDKFINKNKFALIFDEKEPNFSTK
jgi:tubulin monoglycylase TTLL3/8